MHCALEPLRRPASSQDEGEGFSFWISPQTTIAHPGLKMHHFNADADEQAGTEGVLGSGRVEVLRIYCEMISPERLRGPDLRAFFKEFRSSLVVGGRRWGGRVELVLKVELPGAEGVGLDAGLLALLREREALCVDRIWLWGQLADRSRIYLNTGSWPLVFAGWERLVDGLDAAGLSPEGLFFDLEPDFDLLEGLFRGDLRALWSMFRRYGRGDHRGRVDQVAEALGRLRARVGVEVPVLAACFPTGWLGPLGPLVARVSGAPLVGTSGVMIWDEVTAMNYTSFLLPWMGGANAVALWIAARAGGVVARAHVRQASRQGARGSVICGVCGVGVLGDEPCYPSPESMASVLREVAQAGPRALEIFNLMGLIQAGAEVGEVRVDEDRWRRWAWAVSGALSAQG